MIDKNLYQKMADEWLPTIPRIAQSIVAAEKVMNFETARDKPNPKWPESKHETYYHSRMAIIEKVKKTEPVLYNMAVKTANCIIVKRIIKK